MGIKIDRVQIHAVVVPMKPGTVHSQGIEDKLCKADALSGRTANFWEFPKWIIELVADDGTVGLGEPRRGDLGAALQEAAKLIVGKTITDLPIGNLPLPHGATPDSYLIYEAFEMAWFDLLAKHLGVPLWHLLGGKVIDRVPIDFWMGRMDAEETGRRALVARNSGFHGVKMKCALGDPIAERVRAVKEVMPRASVVLDPNERFGDVDGALRVAKSLRDFEDVIFESPLPQHDLESYARLRSMIPFHVALHLTSAAEVMAAVRAGAADYFNLIGPLREFTELARLTRAGGYPTWRGTGMDLGIRDMSSVHAAAAAGCGLGSDIIGHMLREDDLICEPIGFDEGALVVPDRPGLGVTLDRVALEKYRVVP